MYGSKRENKITNMMRRCRIFDTCSILGSSGFGSDYAVAMYDLNGNISHYVSANGDVLESYSYDPRS